MSCILLDKTLYDNLADVLRYRMDGKHNYLCEKRAISNTLNDLIPNKDALAFVQTLADLNVKAYNIRYRDTEETFKVEFVKAKFMDSIQLIANLACIKYQLNEGDIDSTAEFALLDNLIGRLSYAVISNTEAYDKANWGY